MGGAIEASDRISCDNSPSYLHSEFKSGQGFVRAVARIHHPTYLVLGSPFNEVHSIANMQQRSPVQEYLFPLHINPVRPCRGS